MSDEVILNAEPLGFSSRARALWESRGRYLEGDPTAIAPEEAAMVTVLIVRLKRYIDSSILACLPRLHTIVTATTGLDHLDMASLQAREIRVLSLRDHPAFLATIPSTAEYAFALMLSLLRSIPAAHRAVVAGEWDRDRFRGWQAKGRRVGIVGLGRTGAMVAGYAKAFGMNVRYFDPYVSSDYPRAETLDSLVRWAEIVTLHVHLTEETTRMIDARVFEAMSDGSWLVNTARGDIVDEEAAYQALRSGRLAGLATDVIAGELKGTASSALRRAADEGLNVILTPHLGGATWDAMDACEEFIATQF